MRMDLVLAVLDVPGQLVRVLEPISGLGANLVTVIHNRDVKDDKGKIPVRITLEGKRESLNRVIDKFNELEITILEMDDIVRKIKVSTILIGHIVDTDIRDTMDKINQLNGVYVVGFDIQLNGENKSSALLNIETDVDKKQLVFDKVEQIAKEKQLLMINEV